MEAHCFFAKVSRCVKLCDRSGVDSRMGSFSRTAMTAVWPFQCRTLSWLVFVLLWESRPWPNSRIKCSSSRPKRACSKYTATKKLLQHVCIYIYIIYIILFCHIAIWQLCHSDSHPLLFRLAGKLPRSAIASEIKCSGKTRGDLPGKPKPWSGDK